MPSLSTRLARHTCALVLCLFAFSNASATEIRADDLARYLAGMESAPQSPVQALSQEGAWREHARQLDAAWLRLEKMQLAPVREWSRNHVSTPNRTLLYMFSGPDYLYARSFFPHADTYVLAGLEAPGVAPDLAALSADERERGLDNLRASMKSLLNASFFITANMQKDLHGQGFAGVLPVLYVFLARSGMEIRVVSHVRLSEDGEVTTVSAPPANRPAGVKIVFYDREHRAERTLFYFSADLSNAGLGSGALLKFLARQGPADAFFKSASYLVHGANFSRIRSAILERSTRIIQDDTGVRLDDYDPGTWQVTPFGRYARPIPSFEQMFQPSMAQLFQDGAPAPLNFRLGYGFSVNTTGILLATRR